MKWRTVVALLALAVPLPSISYAQESDDMRHVTVAKRNLDLDQLTLTLNWEPDVKIGSYTVFVPLRNQGHGKTSGMAEFSSIIDAREFIRLLQSPKLKEVLLILAPKFNIYTQDLRAAPIGSITFSQNP